MTCHCFDSGMGRRRAVMIHKSGDLPHCKAHNKLTRMRGCMIIYFTSYFLGLFVVNLLSTSLVKREVFIVPGIYLS